jgi:hypothetical protein
MDQTSNNDSKDRPQTHSSADSDALQIIGETLWKATWYMRKKGKDLRVVRETSVHAPGSKWNMEIGRYDAKRGNVWVEDHQVKEFYGYY